VAIAAEPLLPPPGAPERDRMDGGIRRGGGQIGVSDETYLLVEGGRTCAPPALSADLDTQGEEKPQAANTQHQFDLAHVTSPLGTGCVTLGRFAVLSVFC
jgi:hypothetical protein